MRIINLVDHAGEINLTNIIDVLRSDRYETTKHINRLEKLDVLTTTKKKGGRMCSINANCPELPAIMAHINFMYHKFPEMKTDLNELYSRGLQS